MDQQTLQAIESAVERAFASGVGDNRYIDVSRIPLICQSIIGIGTTLIALDKKLDEKFVTKDQFAPVRSIVYGVVGLMLLAVVGSLILLVLPHVDIIL